MRNLSIGLRLTVWYALMFAGAQLIFGLGMWFILSHHLYDIADDSLEGQIDDLENFLKAQSPDLNTTRLQETIGSAYLIEHSGDYLQVLDDRGDWIYRAPRLSRVNWAAPDVGRLQAPLYEDRELEGEPYRFLSEILVINGHRFVVQTGVQEDDVLHTLQTFRNYLLAFALLMLGASSAVGYWLSRKALAPVDVITQTARRIGGGNLSSRLETLHTNDELRRLSDTLNEMLARIEASFARVSQFTADASHELRTPISLMRTEAEIALRKSRSEPEYREALEHILTEAERTSGLIENLLSLARADAGRELLNFQTLRLTEIAASVARDWQAVMLTHDLHFALKLPDREVRIAGDEVAIRRLMNILLDNAVKYTAAGGRVEISLDANSDRTWISVADTGIGISENDQPRVFERFYRADKARSRESGGAGLGLAIAQWIVQQHNGSIELKSTFGIESTFIIVLPILTDVSIDGEPAALSTRST